MSGVRRVPSTSTDSLISKSQHSSMPALRRRGGAGARPTARGRSAIAAPARGRPVSVCSELLRLRAATEAARSTPSAVPTRFCSTSFSLPSTFAAIPCSGCTRSSMALLPAVEVVLRRLLELRERRPARARGTTCCSGAARRRTGREGVPKLGLRRPAGARAFPRRPALRSQFGFETRTRRRRARTPSCGAQGRDSAVGLGAHDEPDADGQQDGEDDERGDEQGHVRRSLGESVESAKVPGCRGARCRVQGEGARVQGAGARVPAQQTHRKQALTPSCGSH